MGTIEGFVKKSGENERVFFASKTDVISVANENGNATDEKLSEWLSDIETRMAVLVELKDAPDDVKTEYGFRGSTKISSSSGGLMMEQFPSGTSLSAGDIVYVTNTFQRYSGGVLSVMPKGYYRMTTVKIDTTGYYYLLGSASGTMYAEYIAGYYSLIEPEWINVRNVPDRLKELVPTELKDATDALKEKYGFIHDENMFAECIAAVGGAITVKLPSYTGVQTGKIIYSDGSLSYAASVYGPSGFPAGTVPKGYYKITALSGSYNKIGQAGGTAYSGETVTENYERWYLGESYMVTGTDVYALEESTIKITENWFACMEELKDISDTDKLAEYGVGILTDSDGQYTITSAVINTGVDDSGMDLYKIPKGLIVYCSNTIDASEASVGYYRCVKEFEGYSMSAVFEYTQEAYDNDSLEYFIYLGKSSIGMLYKK